MENNDGQDRTGATTTVKAIEYAVAYFFGMRTEELHQQSTTRAVKVPRQIAMYLIKQMTDASVPEIGRYYGNKRYANVERSIAKLEQQRCKRGVVDLVIRELVERTELRLTRERRRLGNNHRKPM
jgi:chromosomal replication initiator protein